MEKRSINILLSSCIVAAAAVLTAATDPDGNLRVVLTPQDPVIATGENLTITCTVGQSGNGSLSADDLYFRVNNSALNASSAVNVVLANGTAVLSATNVQRNMSGVVECHHRSPGVTPDATRVLVADKPKKPRIRECIVRNWENMSCFWDGQEDNGIQTDISVCYSTHDTLRPCHVCQNPDYAGNRSCSWFIEDKTFVSITHYLFIQAKNQLGWDYDVRKVDPDEHAVVQPESVRGLNCVATSSQSCFLNWTSPSPGKSLNYRVRFKSRWDANELNVSTNLTSVTLVDLVPSAIYRFVVDCIPLVKGKETGIWSSVESCDCQTLNDVPAMNPPVTFGSYRVLTSAADGDYDRRRQRLVQLYWQPIPRRWANGEIIAVRLKVTKRSEFPSEEQLDVASPWKSSDPETSWRPEFPEVIATPLPASGEGVWNFDGSVTNASVALDVESTYSFTVEARTCAGFNESLRPLSIVVPKKNETPPFPDRFVVATDFLGRYHTLINTSTFPNASGYTIYWCTTSGNRPDICSSSYNWTRIIPVEREHELHLPDHPCTSVRFQVSVESMLPSGEMVSSGMLPVDSIYARDGVVRKPEKLRFSEGAKDSESFTIRWNIDKSYCERKSVYISHYVIRYCSTTCQEKVVEGSVDVASVSGLLPGTVYRVQMKSCSFNQESDFTTAIVYTTVLPLQGAYASYSQKDKIISSVSIATVGMALVCSLLICCRLKRRRKTSSILIVVPKKCSMPNVELLNDGYETHALPIAVYDQYLNAFNTPLRGENSQQTHVIYSAWMTTTEPHNPSSHIFIPHINSPSMENSSVRCHASTSHNVLPGVHSNGTDG